MTGTFTRGSYYQLTEWHGYGETFDSMYEALAHACERLQGIRRDNEENNRFVPLRVTIDNRMSDESGDRIEMRYTLSLAADER